MRFRSRDFNGDGLRECRCQNLVQDYADTDGEVVRRSALSRDRGLRERAAGELALATENGVVVDFDEPQINAPTQLHIKAASEFHGEIHPAVAHYEIIEGRRRKLIRLPRVKAHARAAEEGVGKRSERAPLFSIVFNLHTGQKVINARPRLHVRRPINECFRVEMPGDVTLEADVPAEVVDCGSVEPIESTASTKESLEIRAEKLAALSRARIDGGRTTRRLEHFRPDS